MIRKRARGVSTWDIIFWNRTAGFGVTVWIRDAGLRAMTELSELPPEQRVASYRALAEEAQRLAARALSDDTRSAYLLMCQQWLRLATEVEAAGRKLREAQALAEASAAAPPPEILNEA